MNALDGLAVLPSGTEGYFDVRQGARLIGVLHHSGSRVWWAHTFPANTHHRATSKTRAVEWILEQANQEATHD